MWTHVVWYYLKDTDVDFSFRFFLDYKTAYAFYVQHSYKSKRSIVLLEAKEFKGE